jgi:hypothetical protein
VTEINIYGAGRALSGSVWQQTPPGSITAGFTMLTSTAPVTPLPGDDRILAGESNNQSMSANQTCWQPLPLFAGTVSLYFQSAVALANDFVVATGQGLQYGDLAAGTATNGVVWASASVAGTAYTAQIEAGNAPLYFIIKTGSSASDFTFSAQGN